MNILDKIFGRKLGNISKKQEVMVKVSSINVDKIPANAEIISESEIPEYCSIGNLIFEKKFHEAIELGEKLIKKTQIQ